MIADWPITGERVDGKVYSDVEDNIYEIEKNWPEEFGPVRKVNQMVVWLGVMEEVKTYIVAPPLICKSFYSECFWFLFRVYLNL